MGKISEDWGLLLPWGLPRPPVDFVSFQCDPDKMVPQWLSPQEADREGPQLHTLVHFCSSFIQLQETLGRDIASVFMNSLQLGVKEKGDKEWWGGLQMRWVPRLGFGRTSSQWAVSVG